MDRDFIVLKLESFTLFKKLKDVSLQNIHLTKFAMLHAPLRQYQLIQMEPNALHVILSANTVTDLLLQIVFAQLDNTYFKASATIHV